MSELAHIWDLILLDLVALQSGTPSALTAFGQVILIDLVLAGDNAIIIGALAAGLPAAQRKKVIFIGVIAALLMRLVFALLVSQLMQVIGLVLAGGLLLLWVAWKMWHELHAENNADGVEKTGSSKAGFWSAAWAVAVADISMSLDNVLAVGGAAREHPGILIIGLVLSVILMGVAANVIARYIERYRWIAYVGLAVILWVAVKMIYDGLLGAEVGVLPVLGL